MVNKWLTSTVDTYLKHYGQVDCPTIYDVGSRDGHDGIELGKRIARPNAIWSSDLIVLFECNPPSIDQIKKNYPQATLITEAISDVPNQTVEFLQIHGDQNMVGSSTLNLNRNDKWIKSTSKVEVKTRRLDDVIESLGHQNREIDICKIDVEGYSTEVLESMGKYLRNTRVFHIEGEIPEYARNKTVHDIVLFMTENGYNCTAIEYEWGPEIVDTVWIRQGDK